MQIDIIHESLIANWQQLRAAVADRRDIDLQSESARELLRRSREQREAERNAELERQRKLAAAERQRTSILRRSLVIVAVLLLLALGAAWFAFDRQQIADERVREAESQALAFAAQAQPDDPPLALLLAYEAFDQAQNSIVGAFNGWCCGLPAPANLCVLGGGKNRPWQKLLRPFNQISATESNSDVHCRQSDPGRAGGDDGAGAGLYAGPPAR